MKKYLQKNLNKEVKELMGVQAMLEEYDHENKSLNRQVLKLLQENTRLKMEKVQSNIINILPSEEKKKAMHLLGSRKLDKYKCQQLIDSQKKGKVGISQVNDEKDCLGRDLATREDKENPGKIQLKMQKLKEEVFFSFGTNAHPDLHAQSNTPIKTINQPLHTKQRRGEEFSTPHAITEVTEYNEQPHKIGASLQNRRSELRRKQDCSSQKNIRTMHSIKPSPQVTPLRADKQENTTPSRATKAGQRCPQQSKQKARQGESIQQRRRYIQVVSVFLTPSRSSKGRQAKCQV